MPMQPARRGPAIILLAWLHCSSTVEECSRNHSRKSGGTIGCEFAGKPRTAVLDKAGVTLVRAHTMPRSRAPPDLSRCGHDQLMLCPNWPLGNEDEISSFRDHLRRRACNRLSAAIFGSS